MYNEKPKLSEDTIKRMRGMGLEPDEMSEEQLEAIESLDNPEKSHWLAKPFAYIGGFLELIALFSLLTADWGAVIGFGIIGLIITYIGYRIQRRITAKKFIQASLKKDMEKREPEAGKLWSPFKGMANTDEVLIEKAKAFAPFLFSPISDETKSLFEELKKDKERKIDEKKFGEVFFEMVLFNIHYVDRSAFSHLGAEKRNVFMDALVIEFGEALSIMHERSIEAAQFSSSFAEAYEERQEEYSKYKKSFPEKNEGAKNTLFWEFGKKILGVLGLENNVWLNMYIIKITFAKYKLLELSELFSEQ
ncbi:MAG: hypothetical protein O8C67_01805 [Candidatus Methanoperedens sp.]|nr:hypothetical protein [Candidatus Methanoperedens sp.]